MGTKPLKIVGEIVVRWHMFNKSGLCTKIFISTLKINLIYSLKEFKTISCTLYLPDTYN